MNELKKYNGWSNYQTWAIALWIDNEYGSYHYWQEQIREQRGSAATCSQVKNGIWTASEAAKYNLADQLREEIRDQAPLDEASMYSDLLRRALDDVNWQEIAGNWLTDLDEPEEEKKEDKKNTDDWPLISSYSRAQAIADGLLIDVTDTAKEAGIRYPTAVTSAVWKTHVDIPKGPEGRTDNDGLWNILLALRTSPKEGATNDTLLFTAMINNYWYLSDPVQLKAVCSMGDSAEPVITIMFPGED